VHFRVWAPRRTAVDVLLYADGAGEAVEAVHALQPEGNGYFSGLIAGAAARALYRYRLDRSAAFPDPASRFQPGGPHGPSQVVDPTTFAWKDRDWTGTAIAGQLIYEMHIGTFTREGTWSAAMDELPEIAALGVTVLELMPVADFSGRFGWGYDGVDLYAPTRLYGDPDDMRRFVDRAHAAGLAVILDVVYNHFGPDGAYFREFSPDYFTDRYVNEWGEPINFDGDNATPVRDFIVSNAGYWIEEFHLDGLRLDATQQIFDRSEPHVIAEITARVREAAGGRRTIVVAENEPQHTRIARPLKEGGFGIDALWNDDLHRSAMVAATGRNEAYYSDYLGNPQEFVSAAKWGYLYQGQRFRWQKKRRGTPGFGLPPAAFVTYMQNHDQIANTACGERVHQLTSPGRLRALTSYMLLAPGTPMLFQGQEFAASSPFLFFADHKPDLAKAVREGRRKFLCQFPSIATPESQARLADPCDPATFERCKLDLRERQTNARIYAMHRDLIALRKSDAAFRAQQPGAVDGAVLGTEAFVLRFSLGSGDDRLLLVNLGRDLHAYPAPEPLLAPPEGNQWEVLWSSEDPRYGGCGTPLLETEEGWKIPGHAAVVLRPREAG
jgi:maltooligosyltrehalose trehalohydrolase